MPRGYPIGVLFAFVLLSSTAAADFDARRGVVDSAGSAYAYGFEGAAPGRPMIGWDDDGTVLAEARLMQRFTRSDAIEGEGALRIGGGVGAVHLDATTWPEDLVGRRVEMRLWVRPRGTDAEVQLWWASGDPWPGFSGQVFRGAFVAQLVFFPSGRATNDGWVELTSGPVDFALGGRLVPDVLTVFDSRFGAGDTEFAASPDPDGAALIDGFEIIDLGPAAVPDTTCRLPSVADDCGADGVCLFGRCVDGAAVIGPNLPPALREAVLDRRAVQLLAFDGSRTVAQRWPDLRARFDALADEDVGHRFWSGLRGIFVDSGDGHASGPLPTVNSGASDICTAPGVADRLPGAPTLPLVYRTGVDPIADLQPGDAIARIDGLPPLEWLAATRSYADVQGDPAAFDIDAGRSLLDLAALLGAELEVHRCADGEGCSAAAVEVLTVDLRSAWDALWADDGEQQGNSLLCDYRLEAFGLNGHSSVSARDEGDVRVLAINGVPGDSRRWREQVAEALDDDPELVVIDQRVGFGGQALAVEWMLERLLPEGFTVGYSSYPATDDWDVEAADAAFTACLDAIDEPAQTDCGIAEAATMVGVGAAPRRVAVLGGAVISGNEYLLRMLQARDGIRVFAPAPTIGGFGWVFDLPSLVGELSGGRVQFVDTVFDHRPRNVFDTGTGIPPDVQTIYRQSDIIAGRDTFVDAAIEWLTEEAAR